LARSAAFTARGAVEREAFGGRAVGSAIPATRLLDPIVADHLAVLGQLSDPEITGLMAGAIGLGVA